MGRQVQSAEKSLIAELRKEHPVEAGTGIAREKEAVAREQVAPARMALEKLKPEGGVATAENGGKSAKG